MTDFTVKRRFTEQSCIIHSDRGDFRMTDRNTDRNTDVKKRWELLQVSICNSIGTLYWYSVLGIYTVY